MKQLIPILLAVFSLAAAAPVANAKDEVSPDGVKVEKMSPLRKLVPEGELEAAALQQYVALKQQAGQQGALLPEDHPQVQRLRTIAKKLIPHAQRWNPAATDWKWEVNLFDVDQVNAFCMPGGKIGFFSGILSDLKLTDDEVAVVMGHEIAHALREHGRERLAKSSVTNAGAKLLGFGLSALLGIDPNLTDTAAGVGANLAILKFSRGDETEADLVGLDIVARAGYDPRAGVALWQKMSKVSRGAPLEWLSTHPAGKTRIAEMQKHMPAVMPLYAKVKGLPQSKLPPYTSNVKTIAPVP
ncbi:MAG TPA: M48 family metallopeptidase [Noviherbaspirillum sp.]|uniref:M48 family metallopeptidase n=1 Tax=Noviherbaspirillum sp. TaxID=1926288 RepID=UPI002D225917|nr:M48 family metallopeptidase [Noviherbaspirillum sp.]HYD95147.1 M48 family metallopeptidase [Noviherbaspirillum sp.]